MGQQEEKYSNQEKLEREMEELRHQLEEATETIEAIRTGQIDALVVQGETGHQLYTLQSADQTYRIFIEKMTEGAVTLNIDGRILYCNTQFAHMVKMPLSQVIGMPFVSFVAEESKAGYNALFNNCWNQDCKGEVLLVAADQLTPVQLSLTTLELQSGVSLSIILTDLTAQKQTQQQLQENNVQLELINKALEASNHDLQQFASVASHDLQEPLRKIQVFANLLKETENNLPQNEQGYLNKILESSSRMRSLIIDILNYSRLSAEEEQLECTDLEELISELKVDLELMIKDKNAIITAGKLPCIDANKGQVRQVLQNLMSNALKFSKPGVPPIIHIEATNIAEKSFESPPQEDGPFCQVTITDNGIGFDEKYVNNIFALFERLNAKDKYEGTGIGLAIAKKIIEKHNGMITAASQENKGSTFKIILPITQPQ